MPQTLRIIELAGSPGHMGEAFGEACRAEIRAFYDARLANAISQATTYGGRTLTEADVLAVARRCLPATESYHPEGYEELFGIARGAGLSIERLWTMNALTDLRDTLAWSREVDDGGCSSVIVQGDRTRDGQLLCGQTWDLATDNRPFVVGVRRKPDNGPRTSSVTTVGCLSLIGMNEFGLAIGTTNLRTTDARVGVCYLSLVHKGLGCRTRAEAVADIVCAPRAAGHYYYVCDADGGATAVECTATRHQCVAVDSGFFVECNHVRVREHEALEGETPKSSSRCRLERMQRLLGETTRANLDAALLMGLFATHEDGAGAICRHDIDGISTHAAVVMQPAERRIRACHGYPCASDWIDLLP